MKQVIIVDDDILFSEIIAETLTQRSYLPTKCSQFEEVFEQLELDNFHLVFTDIFMPGIGGIEGIRRLRAKFPHIKIIAISGGWDTMSPAEAVDAAIKIGADAGLKKPYTSDELQDVLVALGEVETKPPSPPINKNPVPVKNSPASPTHQCQHQDVSKAMKKIAGRPSMAPRIGWMVLVIAMIGVITLFLILPSEHKENLSAKQFIDQMKLSAEHGKVSTDQKYGDNIIIKSVNGKTTIIAEGISKDLCLNAAWSLAQQGMISINGKTPKHLTMSLLGKLCSQKSSGATLSWMPGN